MKTRESVAMINELTDIRSSFCKDREWQKAVELFPGIELCFFSLTAESLSVHHAPLDHIFEINYCHSGRIGWEMSNGNSVCLGPKDFSLHTLKACADSVLSFPNGFVEGLTISIDLKALTDHPPQLLCDTGITGELLYNKFCKDGAILAFAGNERTEQIFSAFYHQPEPLQIAYQKIKALELLLYISAFRADATGHLTEYHSAQVETIRSIHEYLIRHMSQRWTVEALSKQFLMNPTTLKVLFKSVYGTSIAAHMKEHRMEQAAKLLRETSFSIAEIAGRVGYDSQSKFTAAFKEYSGKLPKDYRHNEPPIAHKGL